MRRWYEWLLVAWLVCWLVTLAVLGNLAAAGLPPGPPMPAAGLQEALESEHGIELGWDPAVGVTGYRLSWGTNSEANTWSLVTTNTSVVVTNIVPGVNYYFAVSSVAGDLESERSAGVDCAVPVWEPHLVTNLVLSVVIERSDNLLRWGAFTNASVTVRVLGTQRGFFRVGRLSIAEEVR